MRESEQQPLEREQQRGRPLRLRLLNFFSTQQVYGPLRMLLYSRGIGACFLPEHKAKINRDWRQVVRKQQKWSILTWYGEKYAEKLWQAMGSDCKF